MLTAIRARLIARRFREKLIAVLRREIEQLERTLSRLSGKE
jgi:hypothetical protein